jgi:hypothetical protein
MMELFDARYAAVTAAEFVVEVDVVTVAVAVADADAEGKGDAWDVGRAK